MVCGMTRTKFLRGTNISPRVVSDPQYRRRGMCSVAVFAQDKVLQVEQRTVMCHAESQVASSSSSSCRST